MIEREYKYLLEVTAAAIPDKLNQLQPAHVIEHNPIPESLLGLFEFVPHELEQAGFTEKLLTHFDVGFDAHHQRITFPIRDLFGNLVGISGRTVVDQYPRYKVYDYEYTHWGLPKREPTKGSWLWNANAVYAQNYFKSRPDPIILVEGFKAAMWVHQLGYPNVVALLGSSMTEAQQWILERLGAPVYILLDFDKAGQTKVEIIARRLARSLNTFVCLYPAGTPAGTQPDSLTEPQLTSIINTAEDFFLWSLRKWQ
jgi:DNA primase